MEASLKYPWTGSNSCEFYEEFSYPCNNPILKPASEENSSKTETMDFVGIGLTNPYPSFVLHNLSLYSVAVHSDSFGTSWGVLKRILAIGLYVRVWFCWVEMKHVCQYFLRASECL